MTHPLNPPANPARRRALQGFALTAASLAAGGAAIGRAHAASKVAQAAVAYRTTPHGKENCGNCRQFIAPAACRMVAGTVSPDGWCRIYAAKPG